MTSSAMGSTPQQPRTPGEGESAAAKAVRSRRGCFECRKRKIKCDERKPQCALCEKSARECEWPKPGEVHKNKKRRSNGPRSTSRAVSQPQSDGALDLDALFNGNHNGGEGEQSRAEGQEAFSPLGQRSRTSFSAVAGPGPSTLDRRHSANTDIPSVNPTSSFDILQQILPAHMSVQNPTMDPQTLFDPFHHPQHNHYPFIPQNGDDHVHIPPPRKRRKRSSSSPDRPSQDEFSEILLAADRQAELMADSAFLAPYFPRVSDRLVMRHYLLHSSRIIMAYDSTRHPWNPWILLHAPAAFKSLPGVNLAEDALRTALLAVGGVHLRYGGTTKDALGAWKITHQARTQVWSLVKRTSVWEGDERDENQEEELDTVLAALLGCTIASSLAADDLWHEFLMSVISFLDRLGGPASLLPTGRQDRMSLRRFCLEQLATREIFGCMSTDQSPRILTPNFEASFCGMERWSAEEKEWESIDKMFGISRYTVCIIARATLQTTSSSSLSSSSSSSFTFSASAFPVYAPTPAEKPKSVCRLLAVVRENDYHLIEEPVQPNPISDPSTIQLRLPPKAMARLTHTPQSARLFPAVHAPFETPNHPIFSPPESLSPTQRDRAQTSKDANALLRDFNTWESTSSFTLPHPRTAAGDHAYRHTLRLRMLREVFRLPREEERVQSAVRAIMEIAKEVLAWYGRITWMTWPILAAGFSMFPGDPSRTAALEMLCEFEPHACFDNAAACRALLEFWRYNDASEGDLLPTEVFRRLESRPFLD